MGNWHPLTVLILAVEYHLFGMSPVGYHAVNLLLHLLNVLLVFYAVFLLCGKAPIALITALLFGIHPLHVESVAWVAELKDLLYTCFFLASLIFYLKYIKDKQKKHYLISLLLFLVSLLSKAMAASLSPVLILTDYFKGRKIDKKTLTEKVPFFVLAFLFGVVAIIAQRSVGATQLTAGFSFPQRIVFASYEFISYLAKLVFPLNISSYYPYPLIKGGIPFLYYACLILLSGLIAYTLYSRRFTNKILFGIGFFAITVLLVLQLLPVGKAIMADRYSYIPSIGIFYLAGEGFMYLWNKPLKWPAIALLGLSSILFSIKTYSRSAVWKDDMTLWNDVISRDRNVAEAYYSRGILYMNEKRNVEAIKDFNRVIELEPGFANSYNGRGVIFTWEGKNNEAISEFNKAIELNAGYAEAYNNRGLVFLNSRRIEEATRDFSKAIELKEGYAEAYWNRGTAFANAGRSDEAIKDFTKAAELKPVDPQAYNDRGSAYLNAGKYNEAENDLNKAIELNPEYAEAYYNRGILFTRERRNEEAVRDFTKALELKKDYASAYNNRGIVFVSLKKNDEAIKDLTKAVELKPDYADAYNNRGYIYLNSKRYEEAERDFNRAVELNPGFIAAFINLGDLLFEIKRFDEASGAYTKAIGLKADYAPAYYKRGITGFYSGKKALACSDLKKAVDLGYKRAAEALGELCK
jgi:tetratricopeptide (TPR) repeat protein